MAQQTYEGSAPIGMDRFRDPSRYVPDDDLVAAVEVAIMLRQPLLLTGDPGSGKTQLAAWVAYKLQRPLILFVAKSTTAATDLLYRFDAVREFRESQKIEGAIKTIHPRQYLTFQGLGRAVALTYPIDAPTMEEAWDEDANCLPGQSVSRDPHPTASVVLIDEVDKAPRDVPNDLLAEFETGEFSIPELRVKLKIQGGLHPIVIATSNSEKALPDAFLRRCVFHHIAVPTKARLGTILQRQFPDIDLTDKFVQETLELFDKLQGPSPELVLRKKPSVPELLGLLLFFSDRQALSEQSLLPGMPKQASALLRRAGLEFALKSRELSLEHKTIIFGQLLSILFKTKDDQDAARDWLRSYWKLSNELIASAAS